MEGKGTIAIVTWGSAGGPFPRLTRWLAKGLASKGRRVDIIFLQDPRGIRTIDSWIREIGFHTRARWAVLPLLIYFRKTRPSLVITTPAHVIPATLIAGRLAGVPVVPWEQTILSYDKPFLPFLTKHIVPVARRTLYRWLAAIAAVSSDVAREVKSEYIGKQVFVLPNPCCVDCIREAAGPVQHNKGELCKLITVGRLIHQKGIDVLLKALHLLRKQGLRSWQLEILGDGPMRHQYQRMAVELGLEGYVKFMGYVTNPYLRMVQSDIFVHAARWEGFGMVIVEAMALGLPIVATSCPGGPKEILDHGRYGRLVPPDNPDALAETLAELIHNPAERQRLSEAARTRVEFYCPERIAGHVLEIEEYVLNARTMR